MGQYYNLVNMTTKEVMKPYFTKQTEMTGLKTSYSLAVMEHLLNNPKSRLVFGGDYSTSSGYNEDSKSFKELYPDAHNIYDLADSLSVPEDYHDYTEVEMELFRKLNMMERKIMNEHGTLDSTKADLPQEYLDFKKELEDQRAYIDSEVQIEIFESFSNGDPYYLYNHQEQLAVKIEEVKEESLIDSEEFKWFYQFNPIFMLLSDREELGGGDLLTPSNQIHIGSWLSDEISLMKKDELPEGTHLNSILFYECY